MDPWERRPFPPLDLGAVDFNSIRWLVLDLVGPFSVLFLRVQVRERWAGSARLLVPVREESQQQAEALVASRARKPRRAAATRDACQLEGSRGQCMEAQQQQETPASQRAAEDSAWRHSSTAGARRA